jgi:hypothetical protein
VCTALADRRPRGNDGRSGDLVEKFSLAFQAEELRAATAEFFKSGTMDALYILGAAARALNLIFDIRQ